MRGLTYPFKSRRRGDASRSGFTLLELLAVVGVIALLASLLLPALARAKAKANEAACQSALKQLGLGFLLYLSDHEDQFPTGCGF